MTPRIGLSTGACTNRSILDMLPALAASGATGLEISTPPRHFDTWHTGQIDALDQALEFVPMEVVSIHAPFGGLLDLADPNPHHRAAAIGAILTAASAVQRLGGRLIVVHPSDLERHRHNVRARLADCSHSLGILAANCRAQGLVLAVESPLPHLIGGHPDEFAAILAPLDASVRVCLDTGHIALGGQWTRFVEVTGRRLIHVHAHDNRGQWDDHLIPGDGHINWTIVRDSLEAAAFDGWIMLELSCPDADDSTYFRRAVGRAAELFSQ